MISRSFCFFAAAIAIALVRDAVELQLQLEELPNLHLGPVPQVRTAILLSGLHHWNPQTDTNNGHS